ncbi:MAG: glycosyltransferase [Planctomycetes bacterium]|nr:glycosyltransferase [Planctomycetota bacterium]
MGAARPHLLVLTDIFPMEIQPFVTSHVAQMQDRGWRVSVAARVVDAGALARFAAGRPALEVTELRPLGAALASRRGPARLWPLWRRFGADYWRVFGLARSKKRAAESCVLYDIARQIRPDAMHAHFGNIGLLAAPAARALGIPLLVSFHGEELMGHGSEAPRAVYRRAMRGAHAVVYSGYMQEIAATVLDCAVHRVPFGVPVETFSPRPRAEQWPASIGLLVVGRLIDYKGQDVALRALKLLRDGGGDWRLMLVGDGPARAGLEELARSLGVAGHVEFAGVLPQPEVAERMRRADILLVPSGIGATGWQETFCLAALEGMCTGLAVVATRTGALPDTIGDAGPLVPHGDARALADAVAGLVSRDTPRSAAARSLASASRFSLDKMGRAYDELTRSVAGIGAPA